MMNEMGTLERKAKRSGRAGRLAAELMFMSLGLAVLSAASGDTTEDWKAPARKARVKNPVSVTKDSLKAGQDMFLVACAPCHGESGRGDGTAAVSLEREPGDLTKGSRMWTQTDGTLFWKISTGRSPMPAFDTAYSDEQRWHIVNYIRSLAPKPKTKTIVAK